MLIKSEFTYILKDGELEKMEFVSVNVYSEETHVIHTEMVYVDQLSEVTPLVEELKQQFAGFEVNIFRFKKENHGGWEEVILNEENTYEFEYKFFSNEINHRKTLSAAVWKSNKRVEVRLFDFLKDILEVENYLKELENKYPNIKINQNKIFEGVIKGY